MESEKSPINEKIEILIQKLQNQEFIDMLEKNSVKVLTDLGLDISKDFPKNLKFDSFYPIEIQFPWHLIRGHWHPWWWHWHAPWRYKKTEIPLYLDCCCCCCGHP